MKLSELITDYKGDLENLDIVGMTCNSKEVQKGYAFVCINGVAVDGHKFASLAVEKGASVIVCERDLGLQNQVIVSNTRETYTKMCQNYFGNPANKMHLIGVTGTNGKTSITYMLKSVLETAGKKVGLVGTIQNMIGDEVIESHSTTPDAFELNSLFAKMLKAGCEYVVMEVSSHSLHQYRVCNLCFDVAIFTNLTRDHLDYHKTMENYFEAKLRLFKMCKTAVVNFDDEYGKKIKDMLVTNVITYSLGDEGDYSAKSIIYKPTDISYSLVSDNGILPIKVNTGGKFTAYNSMAVAISALSLGLDEKTVTSGLFDIHGVKGRVESVPTGRNFSVIIDYAHTPDGLKNILSTFKECEKNRLVILFGCGGDRDKTKRPIMGSIAVHNADYVIVTSDNPRTEDPRAIIDDILEGTKGGNVPIKVIENRIEAIKFAINTAMENDIIVLAGKGHETYQILKDKTIHLDEREVIAEALKELENNG